MNQFTYAAVDKKRAYVRGSIDAKNEQAATLALESEGMLVVTLQKVPGKFASAWSDFFTRRFVHTVTALDRIALTRNLHIMLEAGISLDKALATTAEQTNNKQFRALLTDMERRVQHGTALHVALQQHAKQFSPFYINFIKVGEQSGKLDTVLAYLLDQQEKDYELKKKAKSAMLYPLIIVVALVLMVTMMMLFVLPRVTSILTEYEVQLPLTTRILIGTSNFLVQWGILFFPALIGVIYLFRRWAQSERGKPRWDAFLLRIPYVRTIISEYNLTRFLLAFTAMLESGITMDRALESASAVPGHTAYQHATKDGVRFVRKGVKLGEVLKRTPKLYPPLVQRMVTVGEETGRLDTMTHKAAKFYEQSVERSFTNLSTVLEPVLLITVGLIVGFVAVSILTPIWNFSDTV